MGEWLVREALAVLKMEDDDFLCSLLGGGF